MVQFVLGKTFESLLNRNKDVDELGNSAYISKPALKFKSLYETETEGLRDFSDITFTPKPETAEKDIDVSELRIKSAEEFINGPKKAPGIWAGPPQEYNLLEKSIRKIANILHLESPLAKDKGISDRARAEALVSHMAYEEGVSISEYRNNPEFMDKFAQGFVDVATFGTLPALQKAITGEEGFAPDSFAGYAGKGLGSFAGLLFGPAKAGELIASPVISRIAVTRDMPLAVRTLRQGLKEALILSPTIGASMFGEALEEKSFKDAAETIVSGLESGALTGAIFGVSRGIFPQEVRHRAARIITGLVALNAQRALENPNVNVWDRPTHEVIFDTAMDVFFMWRGLPRREFTEFERLTDKMLRDEELTAGEFDSIIAEIHRLKKEASRENNKEFENILKTKKTSPPKPKPEDKPETVVRPADVDPDYTFTSQKGNYYEKIGDKWFDSRGKGVVNKFVIEAAERSKVEYGIEEDAASDALITELEAKYKKNIDDITDKEIEDYIIEKESAIEETPEEVAKKYGLEYNKMDFAGEAPGHFFTLGEDTFMVKDLSEVGKRVEEAKAKREGTIEPQPEPELPEQTGFRQQDKELTKQQLKSLPSYSKIDNVDSLIARMETEVNAWLDEENVDIASTKKVISKLADDSKLWAEGSESPPGIFADMTLTELENFAEYMDGLNKWARKAKRGEPGVKLYDIGGATTEGIKQLYDKLIGRNKTKVQPKPPDPFEGVKEEGREAVRTRVGKLNLANYETNKFINKVEQQTTSLQREVMPFVIEKTDIPDELGRPDLQKVLKRDRKYLEPLAEEIKDHFETGFKRVKAHLKDLSAKQIRDYVTHLWDIPKHQQVEAARWFSTQDRFMERRFIDTYKEGIEKGFRPKTLDISEIIKIHDAVGNRAIENNRFIEALMDMKKNGISLLTRDPNEAPLDWIVVNYPALTRRVPLKKTQIKRKGEFVKESIVYAHPDLVKPLKVIFEQRFDGPVIGAYETINGIMKQTWFAASLFHHIVLGQSSVATVGLIDTAKILNPVSMYKALVKGEYPLFKNEPAARDAIENGLVQFGASSDIPVNKIQRILDDLAAKTQDKAMLNRATWATAKSYDLWNKALWNYIHDSFKLIGYEKLVSKYVDTKADAETVLKQKREIGQLINDTFGGQNWEALMISPRMVQGMTWSILSADWTFSTTRQALAIGGIGKIYKETGGLRFKMGLRFWFRAALYFGLGMNLLNALLREKDMKKNPQYYGDKEYDFMDKTMFGNTVGNKTKLFLGRYEDGSERYVKWDKQFADFFELFTKFPEKIGGKFAPIPQGIAQFFTGHTLSGFRNDDVYGSEGLDKVIGIGKLVAKSFTPISVQRFFRDNIEIHPLDIAMQSSKGLSRYSTMEYFKKAIVTGNEDMLREVYVGAMRNNLPAYTLFTSALGWAEGELMAEVTKNVKDLEDAKVRLAASTSAYDKRRYGKIVARLSKEKADKQSGLTRLRAALERARIYKDLAVDKSELHREYR